ncbi:unnamed protein product [Amoebophrya sp. A120]|nr:unnamed protein product [Amoebophrya sp. A120]|eukprot:GSA120T00002223001.1
MNLLPHADCFALLVRLNGDTVLSFRHEVFQHREDHDLEQKKAPWKCWIFRCWDGKVRPDPQAAINKDPLLRQNAMQAGEGEKETVVVAYPIPEEVVAHKRLLGKRVGKTIRKYLQTSEEAQTLGGPFSSPEDFLLPQMMEDDWEERVSLQNFDLYSRLCHPIRSLVDALLMYRPDLNPFYPFYDPKGATDPGESFALPKPGLKDIETTRLATASATGEVNLNTSLNEGDKLVESPADVFEKPRNLDVTPFNINAFSESSYCKEEDVPPAIADERPQRIACLAPVVYHQERAIMVNQSNMIAPYCDDFVFFVANRSAPEYFNGYRVHNLDIISDEWQNEYRSPNGAEKENAMMLEAYFYYFFPQAPRITEFQNAWLGDRAPLTESGNPQDEDDDIFYNGVATKTKNVKPPKDEKSATKETLILPEAAPQDSANKIATLPGESLYRLDKTKPDLGLLLPDDEHVVDVDESWLHWQKQHILDHFPFDLLKSAVGTSLAGAVASHLVDMVKELFSSDRYVNEKTRLSYLQNAVGAQSLWDVLRTGTFQGKSAFENTDAVFIKEEDANAMASAILAHYCNHDRGSSAANSNVSFTETEDRIILELGFRKVSDPSVLGPISPEHYHKFILPPASTVDAGDDQSFQSCIRAAESRLFARILRDVHRRFRESRAKWYERKEFLSGTHDLMFHLYPAEKGVGSRDVDKGEAQAKAKEKSAKIAGSDAVSRGENDPRFMHNAHVIRDGLLETDSELFSAYDQLESERIGLLKQGARAPSVSISRKLQRVRKRQGNLLRVLQSKYRGSPEMQKLVATLKGSKAAEAKYFADHKIELEGVSPDSAFSGGGEHHHLQGNTKSELPDWYCQIESDLYFIPENFERFVNLRNFDANIPYYLGHIWTTITDKVFGLQRTGFSTEVTQGLCVSRKGLQILAEFYKYFYIGRAEKYKILVAEMENTHNLSINQLLASERVARRSGWTWHGIQRQRHGEVHPADGDLLAKNPPSTTSEDTAVAEDQPGTSSTLQVEPAPANVDTLTDEAILSTYFGSELQSIEELDGILNKASTLLEGDLDLARSILNSPDDVLERDFLGGQNGGIVQTSQVATRTFSRRMNSGLLLRKTYWFYNSLRFFSVATSQTYLGHMGHASTDGGSKRSHRVSIDSAFGAKTGHQCLPFQSFVWESYMDLNSICLRELAHVHPTIAVQAIQVTHDAKGRMFWARELDKVRLVKPNPFDELAALPYDYGKKTHAMVGDLYKDSGALGKALDSVGSHFDILWEQRNTFFNRMIAAKVCWKRDLKVALVDQQRKVKLDEDHAADSNVSVHEDVDSAEKIHSEAAQYAEEHETLNLDLAGYYRMRNARAASAAASGTFAEAEKAVYEKSLYYSPFPIAFHGHRAEYNEKIKRVFGQKQQEGGSTRLYFAYFHKDALAEQKKLRDEVKEKEEELKSKNCKESRLYSNAGSSCQLSKEDHQLFVRELSDLRHKLKEHDQKRPLPPSNNQTAGEEAADEGDPSSSPGGDPDSPEGAVEQEKAKASSELPQDSHLIDNRDAQDRTKRSRFTLADVHHIVRGHCLNTHELKPAMSKATVTRVQRLVATFLGDAYRPLVWSERAEECAWPRTISSGESAPLAPASDLSNEQQDGTQLSTTKKHLIAGNVSPKSSENYDSAALLTVLAY